jgi:hypothetical protein
MSALLLWAYDYGSKSQLIPLFPELRTILAEAFELAAEAAEYVVAGNYRLACQGPAGWRNVNLRTQFERILDRAGIDPWPRLFHNLRSSRQTELAESFPSHVVCAWLGNSEKIARVHYLQVTDEHFARAAHEAAHNPAQQAHASGRKVRQESRQPLTIAENCEGLRCCATVQTDGEGFEPTVDFRPRRFSRPVP